MNMNAQPQILDDIIARVTAMTPEQRVKHNTDIMTATAGLKFIPSPGPQTDAAFSKADILLYGGEAGGGKSALILGLALTKHKRSLIMRRQYTDLSGLTEEAIKLNGTRSGFNGSIPPTLRSGDRLIEFGAAQHAGDEQSWMGRPHDLIGIDEAWQMLESQIRFLIGWLRSIDETQRCRVILATNPPLSSDGEWIVPMFAPWLDPGHHNPAKQGELRWYVTDEEGKDVEVEGSGGWIFEISSKRWRTASPDETMRQKRGEKLGVSLSMSRTFIRSSVRDNPFLARTDYAARLDSLRPELRASLRDGNFMAGRKDDARQCIPSTWVRAAQSRWTPHRPPGIPMCAMGVDASGGGADPNVLAPRFDGWYDTLTIIPGAETPNGDGLSGHVIKIRLDNAKVKLDMGGGYGNLCYSELKRNDIPVEAHKGAEGSNARTRDGVYGFVNKRSEIIWRFGEALDPNQPGGSIVALPPDPILVADLCAPRYDVVNHKGKSCIRVESKEDVKERLGRSPDRGDAVTMGWSIGLTGSNFEGGWQQSGPSGVSGNIKVNMVHPNQRRRH